MRAGAPSRGRASSGASRCSERSSRSATWRICSSRSAEGCTAVNTGASSATTLSFPAAELMSAPSSALATWNSKIGIASPTLVLKLSGPASMRRSQGSLSSGSRTTLRTTPAACGRALRPQHGLLARAVGVEGQHDLPREAGELPHLLLGEGGAHRGHGVAETRPGAGPARLYSPRRPGPSPPSRCGGGRGRARRAGGPCGRPAPPRSSRTSAAGSRAWRGRRSPVRGPRASRRGNMIRARKRS